MFISNVVIIEAPTDIIIPSTIEGYPVTSISACYGVSSKMVCKERVSANLTSVVIPNSVTSIGYYAFNNNPLTSIIIGNENAFIGECAFGENPPLDEQFLSNYSCNP